MKAICREFVSSDVGTERSSVRSLDNQIPNELDEMTMSLKHMLATVQKSRQFGTVSLVRYICISLKHRVKPRLGVAGVIANMLKMTEVPLYVTLVPGQKDGIEVRKILIERRPTDAGTLCNTRHRYRGNARFRDKRSRGVKGCIADSPAMLVDRIVP